MAEMLSTSGFGWDDEKKILQVERSVFDEWAKNHKKAKGLYGVPFPYYDLLAEVYGKDRATGEPSESFVQATQNMNDEMTHESVTVDSDDDLELQTETESMQSGSGASGSRKRKDFLSRKKQSLKKKKDEVGDLSSSLHSFSTEFGKVFQDMNSHLGEMAQIWRSEEERKKKLDDESNKTLEEVMKLDILSPSDALEVATILMAEEHKLRVFFQASTAMKKQYLCDILRKK